MQYVSSMYIYNNETGEIKYILFNLIYPKYHFDIIYIKLLVGHLVFFFALNIWSLVYCFTAHFQLDSHIPGEQ